MEISAQLDSMSTNLIDLTEFIDSTNNIKEWKKVKQLY
jgi:hypothetical protein